MYLYHLALQNTTSIVCSAVGYFSGSKQQEILICRGSVLELLSHDPAEGNLKSVVAQDVFGVVRTLSAFRLAGAEKDHVAFGSDSGKIVILEFDTTKNVFVPLFQETFGKSGCRRIVPGQYIAVDPKGRALMVAAVEKSKFVYKLNRDSQAKMTISSPLEGHKSRTIIFDCIALDVGFENPMFACLEVNYSEDEYNSTSSKQKMLTYYEMDFGLNHVIRKWTEATVQSANLLIAVPGDSNGPGGVLVCSIGSITWKHQGEKEVSAMFPQRSCYKDTDYRGVFVCCHTFYQSASMYFVILQSDEGDLYKVTLDMSSGIVSAILISYFDTIPVASSISILRSGYLFAACESSNSCLYQIVGLGDEHDSMNDSFFEVCALRNLSVTDQLINLAPLIDSKLYRNEPHSIPQILALAGNEQSSALTAIRHGLEVDEAAVSEMPGNPVAVWTLKSSIEEEYDAYIVVSFINATVILSIGETIDEVSDFGFIKDIMTLNASLLDNDCFIQIHSTGYRLVHPDLKITEWSVPDNTSVIKSSVNSRQVVLGLSNGTIYYFFIDETGNLTEFTEHFEVDTGICSLAIGKVPVGRQGTRFLAVGCSDCTVKVLSLYQEDCFEVLSFQVLTGKPISVLIITIAGFNVDGMELTLQIGLENGVLVRNTLDRTTGSLSEPRSRFLGNSPANLFAVQMNGPALVALSSKSWINYSHQGQSLLSPLFYDRLEYISSFHSEPCPNALIAICENSLRIFTVDPMKNQFTQKQHKLEYSPKKIVQSDQIPFVVILEASFDPKISAQVVNQQIIQNWRSCISLVDPKEMQSVFSVHLSDGEAAVSGGIVQFASRPEEDYLAVGIVKNMESRPRKFESAFVSLYRIANESLEFVHRTPVDDVPSAFCPFKGKLLVGVGHSVKLYEIGKKQLLLKSEIKTIPNRVVSLQSKGNRIVVGDLQDSVHFISYKNSTNTMSLFADDTIPRWIQCTLMLDFNTVCGGDKFGNFFVTRVPLTVSEKVEQDFTGVEGKGYMIGAKNKTERVCDYYLNDTITSLTKQSLVIGGQEVLFYTGISGSFGVFIPFIAREDVNFFQNLENHMRNEFPSLIGRDHIAFRSSYVPQKNVVDGAMCEMYFHLSPARKLAVAESLDLSIAQVTKKLEDIRVANTF